MDSVAVSSSGNYWRITLAALAAIAILVGVGTVLDYNQSMFLVSAPLHKWGTLLAVLLVCVVADIIINHGKDVTLFKAVMLSIVWAVVALGFGAYAAATGNAPFGETFSLYTTGWGLEMALALDNLIVMQVVFRSFGLMGKDEQKYQTKILYYGIGGMIIMRGLFLSAGASFMHLPTVEVAGFNLHIPDLVLAVLVAYCARKVGKTTQLKMTKRLYYITVGLMLLLGAMFYFNFTIDLLPSLQVSAFELEWPLLLFAGIIYWSATKVGGDDDEKEVDYSKHWSVKGTSWIFPVYPGLAGGKFFVKGSVTLMFLCMVCIEFVDFAFAFDSMPVIIGVVKDPFIMASSNLMACAGLRSLYFVLLAAQNKLWALPRAIKYLLMFIVLKMVLDAIGHGIPTVISLIVVAMFIIGGIAVSLLVKNPDGEDDELVAADESAK